MFTLFMCLLAWCLFDKGVCGMITLHKKIVLCMCSGLIMSAPEIRKFHSDEHIIQ